MIFIERTKLKNAKKNDSLRKRIYDHYNITETVSEEMFYLVHSRKIFQ